MLRFYHNNCHQNHMKVLRLVLALVLISCNKERRDSGFENFPNKQGNHWSYQYRNGRNGNGQTITIDVTGTSVLPDGSHAQIWLIRLEEHVIDCTYVVSSAHQVIFYDPPCWTCTQKMPAERKRFVFPLYPGAFWTTNVPYGDTTRVLSKGPVSVPAGTFPGSYQLSKSVGYATNSYTKDTIWFTPGIGISRYFQNEFNLGPVAGNGLWELKSYSLR